MSCFPAIPRLNLRVVQRAVMVAVGASFALALPFSASHAVTMHVPGYEVVNQIYPPVGVPDDYGDMLFSPDGTTAYFLGNSEDSDSTIHSAPVIRDGSNNVTAFGASTLVVAHPYLDTGLAWGPNSDRLFARTTEDGFVEIRLSDNGTRATTINNYDNYYGGLALVPPGFSLDGLIASSYYDGGLYRHDLVLENTGPNADTHTIGPGTLYADLGTATAAGLRSGGSQLR